MILRRKSILLPGLSLIAVWGLFRCASERPLSGGPPDKTPPTVVRSQPVSGATHISTEVVIKLKFSEKMIQNSVRQAITIRPEPPAGFEIKTTWKTATIRFKKSLKPDQTYLVTLDKYATDLRQNGLDGSFVLAFSTGDKIDAGVLAGQLFGDGKVRSKGRLFLYENTSRPLDSLRLEPPEYVFQPSDTGAFTLPYLALKNYTLFYHWDVNQNGRIDAGDWFGRPHSASVFPQPDSTLQQIRIKPALLPPSGLRLLSVRQLSPNLLKLRLNRPVNNIQTPDDLNLTIDGIRARIPGFAPVKDDDFSLLVQTASVTRRKALVQVNRFVDPTGVILKSDTLRVQTAATRDSVKLSVASVRFQNGSGLIIPTASTRINVQFSLPVIFNRDSTFQFRQIGSDTLELAGKISQVGTTVLQFKPDSMLPDGRKFEWRIQTRFVKSWLGATMQDTLLTGYLGTVSRDSLGSLTLSQNSGQTLMLNIENKATSKTVSIPSDSVTTVNNLNSGKYELWAYEDENSNGKYDAGGMNAFSRAELFWIYPETVRIRARWDLDMGQWDLMPK